jgi:hypothetical protein
MFRRKADANTTRSKSVRSVTGRAQAVEAKLDRAEPYPVTAAMNAGAAGFRPLSGGDGEMNAVAEINAAKSICSLFRPV